MREALRTREFHEMLFTIEAFFILLIILSTIIIFYKTKTIYKLTEHNGIKYFRKGFLFICFAHVLLLLNIIFRFNILGLGMIDSRFIFGFFGLFFLIGIGYLFSSMFSKKIKEHHIYLVTIIVFLLNSIFQTRTFMLIYSTILIIALGIVGIIKLKKGKKKNLFSQIYVIYILIFVSWIITTLSTVFIELDRNGSRLFNLMIGAIIFIYILYLVLIKLRLEK